MDGLANLRDVKLALVVDDSVMQCKVLSVLLKEEGYDVVTANDGASGVAMYMQKQPDLVLMDINMPIMNGYEAARQIKSASENTLCPLIFITSMDSDNAFIESIEAGGDGILVRPFSPDVFKAKIKSIQRISDLYIEVKRLQQEQQKDAELAEQLMSGVIEARNFALDRIGIVKKAATLFSGDIQLTALCPNGDVNVLLGDFTGHGLRSSIGAIPLAETFRTMTKKGFSLFEIISQVNYQLYDLLPPDLFLGAAFVSISSRDESAYIYNAGLPDAYIFGSQGEIKHQISSCHPPMGVLPKLISDTKLEVISVEESDRIILISDGIVEARNEAGEMFEFDRFEQAAKQGVINKSVSDTVINKLDDFCLGVPQEDDISLIDIPCDDWHQNIALTSQNESPLNESPLNEVASLEGNDLLWTWDLTLAGDRLAKVNPIPMAMTQIQEIEGNADHWQNLYTILTELFVNALDHGVLNLSSELKSSAEGFAQYFKEREVRLANLTTGSVSICINFYRLPDGDRVTIKIKDSGEGFNAAKLLEKQRVNAGTNEMQLMGRGISLLEQLCESLEYKDSGTLVHAVYRCN